MVVPARSSRKVQGSSIDRRVAGGGNKCGRLGQLSFSINTYIDSSSAARYPTRLAMEYAHVR